MNRLLRRALPFPSRQQPYRLLSKRNLSTTARHPCSSSVKLLNINLESKRVRHVNSLRAFATTTKNSENISLLEAYNQLSEKKGLRRDAQQLELLEELEVLGKQIVARKSVLDRQRGEITEQIRSGDNDNKCKEEKATNGLYIFGGVGTGKSFCMDLFFAHLPENIGKKRWHFHEFMLSAHQRLHKLKQNNERLLNKGDKGLNPLTLVARDIARETGLLLCFDEFQVTDIGDAMILKQLVETILAAGTFIVFTSNRPPRDLYLNGLNRHLFLPCIAMIERKMKLFNLRNGTDYRALRQNTTGENKDFFLSLSKGSDHQNDEKVSTWMKSFSIRFSSEYAAESSISQSGELGSLEVKVAMGRVLPIKSANRAALKKKSSTSSEARHVVCAVGFDEMCVAERSAHDFIALAASFWAVVLTDVPRIAAMTPDSLRRFITFIDAMYEARVLLALSSEEDTLDSLISGGDISSEPAAPLGEVGDRSGTRVVAEGGSSGRSTTMIGNTEWSATGRKDVALAGLAGAAEVGFAKARVISRLKEMHSHGWIQDLTTDEKAG